MEKVILLTGASGGMGSALAELMKQDGFHLALHYHTNAINVPENENIAHFKADLTKEDDVQKMIGAVMDRFGRIDIVINNAGVSKSSISWKTDASDWRTSLAVNLDAPFYVAKHVAPIMRANNWGRIINITSVVAQTGFIGTAAYAASKAGLIGLTKTLAKELISSNITVNALALGYFNVGMIEDVPENLKSEVIDSIPAKKLGDPVNVYASINWLIGKNAGYVTGQTINLNGGLYTD